MAKIILALNAGSSSVKISVYRVAQKGASPDGLVETQIAGLSSPPATFSYRSKAKNVQNQQLEGKIGSQDDACNFMLQQLVEDRDTPEIGKREDIAIACHRVVHGGDYKEPQVIDAVTYHHLEELTDLAPLHNAAALSIVSSCVKQLPKTRNVAYFDSAFHQTIPEHIRTYPIDPVVARKNKLRKYGFHGISYAFITRSVARHLEKPVADTSIIALHLGSGASACAIKNGESMDTSMGLTPLAGLPGATRSGSIDPSLVFHFTSDAGRPSPSSTSEMHITTAEEILNKKSGWKALTGTTDFGKIAAHATMLSSSSESEDDFSASAHLAFNIFVDRITNYIGSYFVKLDGKVDALVFAGGIGEKSAILRKIIIEKTRCLGFEIDEGRNDDAGKMRDETGDIVVDVSAVLKRPGIEGKRVLVCWTDEQYEMARGCASSSMMWDEN